MRIPIEFSNGVHAGQKFGEDPDTYRQFGMKGHHGLDMPASIGTPVYAPESGIITVSSNGARDQYTGRQVAGETLVLKGLNHEHWLMHLSRRQVSAGDNVSENQIIGYSGNTGYSTGPHLHWGVRPDAPDLNNGYRGFVDPQTVIAATNAPAPVQPTGNIVTLPAHVPSWAVYREGSGYRKGTSDQVGSLRPDLFGGLSYEILGWSGGGVIINTKNYGRVVAWVKDTDAIISRSVVPTPPTPIALPTPKVWPTAPATATDTTPYIIIKQLDGYNTSNKAANRITPIAPVGAGAYYVFNKRYADSDPSKLVAINVTEKLGQPGYWINPEDNVPDPEPVPEVIPEPPKLVIPNTGGWDKPLPVVIPELVVEPPQLPTPTPEPKVVVRPNWRASYQAFDKPVWYIAQKDFLIHDLATQRKSQPVTEDMRIEMHGQFTGPDDNIYLRPYEAVYDRNESPRLWWYGCKPDRNYVITEKESNELYNTSLTKYERSVIKNVQDIRVLDNREKNRRRHELNMVDLFTVTPKEIETFVSKFMDFVVGKHRKRTVKINNNKEIK